MSNDAKWIVHTKGGPDQEFEIAVVHTSNTHGMASFGWFGIDKLLISHNGGPCQDTVAAVVWEQLIVAAQRVADHMNARETPDA